MKEYFQKRHQFYGPLILFILVFLAMLLYQFLWIGPERMAGNDSYSYLGKSKILQEYGPKTASFANILPFSLWHELDTDNTIVYDGFIIPLTFASDEIVAAKLFISVLTAFIAIIFYYGVSQKISNGYKASILVLCGFFLNYAFFLKFTELRPLVFSITFFFSIVVGLFIARDRWYLYLPLGTMYTLLHTTTFLAIIPIVVLFIIDAKNRINYVKAFVFLVLGILFALLIFPLPNFWEMFLLQPLIPLLYLSSDFAIDGAFEAKGDFRTPHYLLIANTFNVFMLIAGIGIYLFKDLRKNLAPRHLAALITFALFVLLDLYSRRFSDYMTPMALVFAALHFTQLELLFQKFKRFVLSKPQYKYVVGVMIVVLGVVGGFLFYSRFLKDNLSGTNYQGEVSSKLPEPAGAGKFMMENLPHNAYIYNSAWEDFPYLVYYAPRFKYAAGAEPGFMYLYDKEMLRFYQDFRAFRNFEMKEGKLIYTKTGGDFRLIIEDKFNTTVMVLKKGKAEKMTNYLLENLTPLSMAKLYEDDYYAVVGLVP